MPATQGRGSIALEKERRSHRLDKAPGEPEPELRACDLRRGTMRRPRWLRAGAIRGPPRLAGRGAEHGTVDLNQDRFLLLRARLEVEASTPQWQYAELTLELDANTVKGPTVSIRRAEATLIFRNAPYDGNVVRHSPRETAPPLAALTMGVTDIPFGFELLDSPRERVFMERTQGSLAFFPGEADVGVRLWGGAGFFRYQLGALINGVPHRPTRPASCPAATRPSSKDIIARIGADTEPRHAAVRLIARCQRPPRSGLPRRHRRDEGHPDLDRRLNENSDRGYLGEIDPAVAGSAATPSASFSSVGRRPATSSSASPRPSAGDDDLRRGHDRAETSTVVSSGRSDRDRRRYARDCLLRRSRSRHLALRSRGVSLRSLQPQRRLLRQAIGEAPPHRRNRLHDPLAARRPGAPAVTRASSFNTISSATILGRG